jgi:hypothetical protein
MIRHAALAAAAVLLPSCGEANPPSATRAQAEAFLAACSAANARILPGGENGTSDWIIDFSTAPRSDWDCLDQQARDAGVLLTKTATKIDESA